MLFRSGKEIKISFVASHAGVFMYHCATQPILLHTSAGMMGMMVVKPRNLAPVDRELWLTQEEFYLGKPGKPADMAKMAAGAADAFAFNGYANQYKANPITVRRGEKIRMYVLDAGPSKWSAFHVIGTVFDKTYVEGVVGQLGGRRDPARGRRGQRPGHPGQRHGLGGRPVLPPAGHLLTPASSVF